MSNEFQYRGRYAGVINAATGAATELAKRGGASWAQSVQPSGVASKMGHKAVTHAAKVAPGLVLAAGAAVAAAPAAVVVCAAPIAVLAAGHGAYRAALWIKDRC
jgi:hypothetical protein